MGFPAYSKVVIMDGIRVPCRSFNASWGEGGVISFTLQLIPSYEAEGIVVGTQVHVFHIEAGKLTYKRESVEVDAAQKTISPLQIKYLSSDYVRANGEATIGDLIDIHSRPRAGGPFSDDLLLDYYRDCGMVYLVGGIVEHIETGGSANAPQQVALVCRGYEVDIDLIQLIQIIGGRGTLTKKERRFFGQDSNREGKPKTLLSGGNKNSFGNALAKLLILDKEYASGIRNIIAQYGALINDMWLHRFSWNRISNQIAIIENDSSPRRLIATTTFKHYLREQMQRLYMVPLRQAVDTILSFIGYAMYSVPAPAYFPIVPLPKGRTEKKRVPTTQKVKGGIVVIVRWTSYLQYDPASLPGIPGVAPEKRDGIWYVDDIPLTTIFYGRGQVRGTLHDSNRRVDFKLPKRNSRGQPVLGGGTDLSITARGYAPGDMSINVARFSVGNIYRTSAPTVVAVGGLGLDHKPSRFLHFTIIIKRAEDFVIKRTRVKKITIPPKPPTRYYSNLLTRLNTYVILPKLWFACPPLCNIIVPEMLATYGGSDPGLALLTRLVGKIPPGKPGSGKVFVDKFSAPNSADLNKAMEDVYDDPIDAKNLQKTEYIAGVRAQVESYGNLAKMAQRRDWEDFIRSMTVQKYWDQRLEGRQRTITLKTAVGIVPGTTVLVIRGTGEKDDDGSTNRLTPEQQALLAKLRQMRQIRARLARARSSLLAHLRRARLIRQWVKDLKDLSETLYDDGVKDAIDTSRTGGLWTDTGGTLENVRVVSASNGVRDFGQRFIDAGGKTGTGTASKARLDADSAQKLANNNAPSPGSLGDIKFKSTFERLLGKDGIKIWPAADKEGRVVDLIQELPRKDVLEGFETKLSSSTGGLGACVGALKRDMDLLDSGIKKAREKLNRFGDSHKEGRSIIGYVRRIQEQSSPDGSQQTWSLSLTHVRNIGEDLDWDGLPGDDVESTVIFGEDGYLDDKYSTENIGKEVYKPMFGTTSILDYPGVREAFAAEISAPLAAQQVSIQSILNRFEHPAICGRKYWEDKEFGSLTSDPDTTFAAEYIIKQYLNLKRAGEGSDAIFAWLEPFMTRPWMTFPDAYRGFPLGWNRQREVLEYPGLADYEPWESDSMIYGFSQASLIPDPVVDTGPPEPLKNPPEGFFSKSILPPYISFPDSHRSEGEDKALLERAKDYLNYGGELDEDELALLKRRQRKIFSYLKSIRHKTTDRRG